MITRFVIFAILLGLMIFIIAGQLILRIILIHHAHRYLCTSHEHRDDHQELLVVANMEPKRQLVSSNFGYRDVSEQLMAWKSVYRMVCDAPCLKSNEEEPHHLS